jgi:hypothetical protein
MPDIEARGAMGHAAMQRNPADVPPGLKIFEQFAFA